MRLTKTQKKFRRQMKKIKNDNNENSYINHKRTVRFDNAPQNRFSPFSSITAGVFFIYIIIRLVRFLTHYVN